MRKGYDANQLDKMLNKESGLLGLSEVSSDMRDVEKAAAEGNKDAQETLDVYIYRVVKYIGSYMATLVKVDAMIFTGGVGENSAITREKICTSLENLGVFIDKEKNNSLPRGTEGIISTDSSPVVIMTVPTNEELQIAADTYTLVYNVELPEFQD